MRVFRLSKSCTPLFQTVMRSSIRFPMFTSWLVWEDRLSNGTTSLSPRCQLTQRSWPRWAIYTSKNKMSSRLFITTKRVTDTTPPKSTSSVALVCTTQNRTCSRRLSSTSREQPKFKPKRSSGNSWLPLATEGWTFSTKPWKSTKKFMSNNLITLTAWEASFKLERNLVCLTNNSVRSSWFSTERRKLREWWTVHKTRTLVVMEEPHKEMLTTWTSSNSSHKHQIWMTLHNQRLERWQHQPNLKKMMMKVGVTQELS